ncbi:MAG: hypothetical protein A2901_00800 [Elusimicrobia bacterium RIFCSPLOWO2_01_FULL_54_10]|nr:MAG: hypothetical protein A2901_00800 [Elusimicrobia bacterium RIFCSPLOWO2_01_FULL_54_10]
MTLPIEIYPLVFMVALAYSSVGHGGASGYLAVLALFGFMPKEMASSALALNLLVAGTAFVAYWKSGHFLPRLFWPFALTSVPCALIGGLIDAPARVYSGLLAIVLAYAAFRLAFAGKGNGEEEPLRVPGLAVALPVGAGIGLLSGLIGVGGGIFLTPVMLLFRWADAKRSAAASAAFIWVNSIAGLYGHSSRHGFNIVEFWPLVLAAFLGGVVGSSIGARYFTVPVMKRVLAGVLVVAAFKMLRVSYG